MKSALIRGDQEVAYGRFHEVLGYFQDYVSVWPLIKQQFAACTTRRDNGEFAVRLVGFGMADGHDGFNGAISFQERAPKGNRFGAY